MPQGEEYELLEEYSLSANWLYVKTVHGFVFLVFSLVVVIYGYVKAKQMAHTSRPTIGLQLQYRRPIGLTVSQQ